MPRWCQGSKVRMDRLVGDCKQATVNYGLVFSATFGVNFTAQNERTAKSLVVIFGQRSDKKKKTRDTSSISESKTT